MTLKEINLAIRETRAEMKSKGIRRISCFNGGLSGEAYRLNARMYELVTRRDQLKEKMTYDPLVTETGDNFWKYR